LTIGWKRNRPVPEMRFVPLNPRTGESGEFRVLQSEAVIGSGEDNQFVIRRPSVSHRHASLAFRKDHYEIADLDSTNGTFVNGRRIRGTVAVKLGDEIRLGDAAFILAKPAAAVSALKRKPVLPKKVLTVRGACELVLLAFAIGFGTAQYLAYLEYHAQNRLILAEAVPVPPISVSIPPNHASSPAANYGALPAAGPPPSVSKVIAEGVAPASSTISDADKIAAKELAGGIALAGLVGGSGTAAGESAPDFTLANLDGNEESLGGMLGKIVMLNFWATWCAVCRGEMPSLEKLYRDFHSYPDFTMLTVSIDQDGKPAVTRLMADSGYDFPVLLDPTNATSAAYGVKGIPSTFVIGRKGQIIWQCVGAPDWSDPTLRAALEKLL
jgi:pSer/pThr/pTyr-binding forkhead associated (FHA) protein/peroxiredoxin